MYVLAFDPGETTGVAWLKHTEGEEEATILDTYVTPLWDGIEETILSSPPDVVVIEDFRLYPGKAKFLGFNEMPAAQVIGVIKFLCDKYEIPYVMQPASIKQAVRGDLSEVKTIHAKDAAKHGVYYLSMQRKGR